eukprot:1600743-Rhodomonas_salina.2
MLTGAGGRRLAGDCVGDVRLLGRKVGGHLGEPRSRGHGQRHLGFRHASGIPERGQLGSETDTTVQGWIGNEGENGCRHGRELTSAWEEGPERGGPPWTLRRCAQSHRCSRCQSCSR